MARSRKTTDKPATGKRRIEQYDHKGQQRKNNHHGYDTVDYDIVWKVATRELPALKLKTRTMLVLEVKGQDSPQNQAKRAALDEWTRAVTAHGGFGPWRWAVSRTPSDVADLVRAAA